ncbi:MAG: UDP-N-acetylmuramoyl-L-alanyl-D-glutamate--2,6-diaminopimelate ligase [Novosphingobium sp.]
MTLDTLVELAGFSVADHGNATVTGLAIDHRKVAPGNVFGAFQGAVVNGEDFIPAAVAAGAVAVVARPEVRVSGAAHIADAEPRRAFAQIAAPFFAPFPDTIVAVTGTNGKTSTVEMTRQIWRMAGNSAASIGTLGVTTPDGSASTGLTSPDIVTFLSNMSGLAREGVSHVAYEASSHGLSQYRTEGPGVAAGAFTNLSRDHLDYHGTMENYLAAKLRLFDEVIARDGAGVVWMDDPASHRVCEHVRGGGLRMFTVGEQALDDQWGVRLLAHNISRLGQDLELGWQGERVKVALPLIGAYQVANALVAVGLVLATGGDPRGTFDALSRLQPVPGRLERAAITRSGAPVYVDYAHTPDALDAALAALRPHAKGKIIAVVGAGGDRDTGKRGPMGAAAARGAELVIVTDDNPRGEDPGLIRAAVLDGARSVHANCREVADRREAIALAIAAGGEGDIVLIAGKGHEEGQIIGRGAEARVLPLNDVTVARECAGAPSGEA